MVSKRKGYILFSYWSFAIPSRFICQIDHLTKILCSTELYMTSCILLYMHLSLFINLPKIEVASACIFLMKAAILSAWVITDPTKIYVKRKQLVGLKWKGDPH